MVILSLPKVLVTGTSGFIGGVLAPKLIELGKYDVYGLERYVAGRYVLGASKQVKTLYGDLRDHGGINQLMQMLQPDFVIHLASLSAVAYSYDHPHEVSETNYLGTMNLAEACKNHVPAFKQFLFASTSETYGNGPVPKTEDTIQNPNSPYAVSKVAAEHHLRYMFETYHFPITILRPFNTYGRTDNSHFIVERIITQMLKGGTVRLGDPEPVRDLLYVDDHVDAYLSCLDNEDAIGETFNFCTGESISIRELSLLIANVIGFTGEVLWNTVPSRPNDIRRLYGNCGWAGNRLGWKPWVDLRLGVERTVQVWRNKI